MKAMNCDNMDNLVNSPSSPTPSQLCLLDLNDYCLLEIMSHLNVTDLILASTLCKRMEYNAYRLFPYRLTLWKDISGDESRCRFQLSKIGEFLTDIEVNDGDDGNDLTIEDTIAMIKENCENLETIRLHHSVPKDLLILPQNLKSISISFPHKWRHTTEFMESLKFFNRLESLTLLFEEFTVLGNEILRELQPLKLLKLENCSIEPMDLKMCLENSKAQLNTLSLSKCFEKFPNKLNGTIEQLDALRELELQFHCGRGEIHPTSIFYRLTSLAIENSLRCIDVNLLFNALIDHNKIHTLSLSSVNNIRPMDRSTLKRLHCLTNLRRLDLCETDFVTDEFLLAIASTKKLTNFTYKQIYQPTLSFKAFLTLAAMNGNNLKQCKYTIYHDIGNQNPNIAQTNDLLNVYRKTDAFQRVRQCKAEISGRMTSVEFLFE